MSEETPGLARHKSVREALQYVAEHPVQVTDPIDTPCWELIARGLFDVANDPNPKVRGAAKRATTAQRIISDRLVGLRRPGTHPAKAKETAIQFRDLTQGAIEGG